MESTISQLTQAHQAEIESINLSNSTKSEGVTTQLQQEISILKVELEATSAVSKGDVI